MRTLLAAALLLAGCSTAKKSATCLEVTGGFGPAGTVAVKTEVVASGLEVPWGVGFLPGGSILLTERPGRIRLIENGALLPDPVATIAIGPGDEAGLLGLELHPDFARNRQFYVYVTVASGAETENRVERWVLAADSRSATKDRDVFSRIPASKFHDGGRIRFGPDKMLYIGSGDARNPPNSQDRSSPSGKILRVTPDGDVPSDNPFAGSPVFLLGVRNTQGFDWRDDATLYVTDHGPSGELGRSNYDEVSVAKAGDNLGWPDSYKCEERQGMVSPSITFATATPPGGAAIYRGDAIAEWRGDLIIGTLGSKHLHRVRFKAGSAEVELHEVYFANTHGRLREVRMGPDGHLYVTTSNCDGRGTCGAQKDQLLRVVPQ
jgi:glucose/arabinose dehydrogenase